MENPLHPEAKPVHDKADGEFLGWIYECADFSYEARQDPGDSVSFYIEWGDDQIADMGSWHGWEAVSLHLRNVIKANEEARALRG